MTRSVAAFGQHPHPFPDQAGFQRRQDGEFPGGGCAGPAAPRGRFPRAFQDLAMDGGGGRSRKVAAGDAVTLEAVFGKQPWTRIAPYDDVGQKAGDIERLQTGIGIRTTVDVGDGGSGRSRAELGKRQKFAGARDGRGGGDLLFRLAHAVRAGAADVGQVSRFARLQRPCETAQGFQTVSPGVAAGFGQQIGDQRHDRDTNPQSVRLETRSLHSGAMSPPTHRDYCAQQVRTYDYDRFFPAALAPGDVRRGLMALYAFNLEIASARERVSESLLGDIRLQWWRDAIGEIYDGSVRDHGVAEELAEAIRRFDLPKDSFDRILDGRAFDMDDDAPEDLGAFDNYIAATAGELTGLAFMVCGVRDRREHALAIGSYWGGTGLLRAMPFHLPQRRVYLPKDLLRRAGVTVSRLADDPRRADISGIVRDLAAHLTKTHRTISRVDKRLRPAAAYAALAKTYLRKLERAGFDVFAPGLEPSRTRRQVGILHAALTGRI